MTTYVRIVGAVSARTQFVASIRALEPVRARASSCVPYGLAGALPGLLHHRHHRHKNLCDVVHRCLHKDAILCISAARHADGKVCIVTGASRGIGKAIALKLGSQGGKVVVNYASSADAAEEVAAAIKASGGDAMPFKCNTGSMDEITAMFNATMDEWGTVDVLVNNAGASGIRSACSMADALLLLPLSRSRMASSQSPLFKIVII